MRQPTLKFDGSQVIVDVPLHGTFICLIDFFDRNLAQPEEMLDRGLESAYEGESQESVDHIKSMPFAVKAAVVADVHAKMVGGQL